LEHVESSTPLALVHSPALPYFDCAIKNAIPKGWHSDSLGERVLGFVRSNPHSEERAVHEYERRNEENERQYICDRRTLIASERNG
jgi:hypothetical protein